MKLIAAMTALLVAACASPRPPATTAIAESCPWVLTPLQDSAQAERQVARTCACAARALEAEWPVEQLERFDVNLAEFATRMRQWEQRTDVGAIVAGDGEPPPEIAPDARLDFEAFAQHVRLCGRGAMEF